VLATTGNAQSLLELWKPALVVGIPWAIIMLQPDWAPASFHRNLLRDAVLAGAWPLLILIAAAISLILSFSVGLWARGSSILLGSFSVPAYLIEESCSWCKRRHRRHWPMMWKNRATRRTSEGFIDSPPIPARRYHVIHRKSRSDPWIFR